MHTSSGVFSILGSKPQKTMHFCEAARANFRHRVATKSLTKSRFFGPKRCVHAVVRSQGRRRESVKWAKRLVRRSSKGVDGKRTHHFVHARGETVGTAL